MKNQFWLKVAFSQFVVIALIGVTIRLIFIGWDVGFDYKNLVHAHSHVGFLGWISMAIYVGLLHQFIPNSKDNKTYQRIFIGTEISILGMLMSFPVQGYGLYSISFSTLFLLTSYWFVIKFYKSLKKESSGLTSTKFAKAALIYLVLSSLGPWALGPTMATGHGKDSLYYLIIFFYLHFLYNGAIIMALFAMIFKYLETQGGAIKKWNQNGRKVFLLLNSSVIPTYALSTLWTEPNAWLYWLGGLFAIVQCVGWIYFLPFGKNLLNQARHQNIWAYRLLSLSGIAFSLKLIFQFLSAFPFFVSDIALLKNTIVMGYIHLVTLGVISFFLIGWFLLLKGFNSQRLSAKIGLWIFVAGVFLSEFYLFGNGLRTWLGKPPFDFATQLALVSSLMPIGLILFLVGQRQKTIPGDTQRTVR
ncbi:MAG TPA: hypothetical protein ENK85_06085 [Saprospiraceae bacterium]|nr:hypothetical protein [Saprospiraceae bacterium]